MRFIRGLGATLSDIMPHAKEERNCPNMNDDATHPAHTPGVRGWGVGGGSRRGVSASVAGRGGADLISSSTT